MSGRLFLLVALTLTVAFAPAPLPRRAQSEADDAQKLQGVWLTSDSGRPVELAIVGARWTFSRGGRVTSEWTAKLAPATTPRQVDLTNVRQGDDVIQAIYRLDGGELTFAYEAGSSGRPTRFDGSDRGAVMRLKRR